jgi:hypothetical protein
MCHITTWEEDYKGNNTSPSLQSPLANSQLLAVHGNLVVSQMRRGCALHIYIPPGGRLAPSVHILGQLLPVQVYTSPDRSVYPGNGDVENKPTLGKMECLPRS